MGGEVEGLDTAAGAEVQGPVDRVAHGELGQRRRGRADPEHVVRAHPRARPVEAGSQVGDHPPVALLVGVGAQVQAGPHLPNGPLEQPGQAQRVEEVGQGALDGGHRDGRLQQEEPGERAQRRAVAGGVQAGGGLVARQGGVGHRTEQRGDRVVGEAGRAQGVAQPGHDIGRQVHGPTL